MFKRSLILSLAICSVALATTVSNIRIDSISHSNARVFWSTSDTSWNFARIRYIPVGSGTCTGGTGGRVAGVTKLSQTNPATVIGGLIPNTLYQVCPEVSGDDSSFTSGVGQTFTTLPLPTVHPAAPVAPTAFDTSYPNTSGYATPTISAGCSNLQTEINNAITRQASQGTILNVPVGTPCIGQWVFNGQASDVIPVDSIATDGTFTKAAHGLTEGKTLIFSNHGCGLPASALGNSNFQGFMSGQIYYAHILSSNTFQIYRNAPSGSGGILMTFSDTGCGTTIYTQWPRALNWIILRTATTDSQFVPEKVRATPAWLPKMASFQCPKEWLGGLSINHMVFSTTDTTGSNLDWLNANIRFVGLEITYQPDPAISQSSDPRPGQFLITVPPTSQNVVFDRCYVHGYPPPFRVYRGLDWDGMNVAFVDSYFENISYFRGIRYGMNVNAF